LCDDKFIGKKDFNKYDTIFKSRSFIQSTKNEIGKNNIETVL